MQRFNPTIFLLVLISHTNPYMTCFRLRLSIFSLMINTHSVLRIYQPNTQTTRSSTSMRCVRKQAKSLHSWIGNYIKYCISIPLGCIGIYKTRIYINRMNVYLLNICFVKKISCFSLLFSIWEILEETNRSYLPEMRSSFSMT